MCAGGAAGIFARVPVLVRSGNGLEACQCGNSQPEADPTRRPRRRDLGRDEKAADMQMALYEALEPLAGKQVLQAIGEQHGLGL